MKNTNNHIDGKNRVIETATLEQKAYYNMILCKLNGKAFETATKEQKKNAQAWLENMKNRERVLDLGIELEYKKVA